MNYLELEFENQKLKADLTIQTSKAMEGSIRLELITKAFITLLGDYQSLNEYIHPDSKQTLRDAINTFSKGDVAWKERALKYVNEESELSNIDIMDDKPDYLPKD